MTTPGGRREPNGRILVVAGAMIAVLAFLAMRLAQLTIVQSGELSEIAWQQYRRTLRTAGSRGAIVDRNHETLADTVATPSIYAGPRYHPVSAEDRTRLAAALDVPVSALERRMNPKAGFVWLKRQATRGQARAVERLRVPGVGIIREGRRLYPKGALAAHVVGHAGADLQGKEGVELLYDRWMRGEDTVLVLERDGRGRSLFTQGTANEAPQELEPASGMIRPPSATLQLTIDAALQSMVERELAAGVEEARADAGTAIVLDPWSGAVLALANVPTYDPNHPARVAPEERRNRAVTDVFEPGSTFKAFSVAAALQEGAVSSQDRIDCENGAYRVGGWTIHDHHRYGLLTVPEVIQYSSNIGATKIVQRLGTEQFTQYLDRFGFGRRTAIDLPGEVPGLLRQRWAQIDLATGSFGQGIAVTPIQLAAAFGAIANGGRLYQPYVLARASDPEGRTLFEWDPGERDAASHVVIDQSTARAVSEMLELVVSETRGTGQKARIPGVRVAGKTGTAQKADKTGRYSRERLASFIGFAPADNPALVTLVMIDNPRKATYGGIVAAPVFAEITSRALDRLGRRPQLEAPLPRPVHPSPVSAAAVAGELVPMLAEDGLPSFLGQSLRRALETARAEGLEVDVRGSGFVVSQEPPPGALRDGSRILLVLEPYA